MQPVVHQDFGEKIGGARKDMRGNVTRDDILRMTPEERLKLVKKEMVWPTPNYVSMVKEQGYTQRAAALVKMLRDGFPATPIFRSDATDEQKAQGAEMYAALLNAAKVITTRGKTERELADAFRDAPEAKEFLYNVSGQATPGERSRALKIEPSKRFGEALKAAFNDGYQESSDMRHAMRCFAEGALDRTTANMIRKNKEWPEGTSLAEGWLRKIGAGVVPHNGEFAVGRLGTPCTPNSYNASVLSQYGFGGVIDKSYPTKEEAEAAMKAIADAQFAKKREVAKVKREKVMARALGRPVDAPAPLVDRVGIDHRDGAIATGDDYLQEFGLRGGEYGLWVNQAERHEVTNKGFDAFCDLADAFKLPHDGISLGGKLAIAFGARGRGGNAAAHYEPGRKAINLTKPSGEGCLAHEWAHALDHHLGLRAQELGLVEKLSDPSHACYLSNAILKQPSEGSPQGEEEQYLRTFRTTMESIWTNRDPKTKEEVLTGTEQRRALALRNLMITIQNEGISLRRGAGNEARLAEFNSHAALVRKPEEGKELECINRGVDAILNMPEFRSSSARRDIVHYHQFAAKAIEAHGEHSALPDDWKGDSSPRVTGYLKACQSLDQTRTDPYFSLHHEMFARSFEAVVTETLKEKGNCNYFLVAGAAGEAYPADYERTKVKKRFGPLLEQLQQFLPSIAPREIAVEPEPPVARPPLAEPKLVAMNHEQLNLL